ncbi:MAG: hypothetical protein M3N18_11865 [Actinomycetota bacterium]|nr:hypothetical protein [Actinomycetota bacterium]
MPVCAGIKRTGGRCTVSVDPGRDYCHHHDPARASERSRAASRAGKSKPARELVGIKILLSDLTDKVLAGDLETGRAAVANQLINTRLRAVEVERKIREQEDLIERLERLEASRGEHKDGRRWGA